MKGRRLFSQVAREYGYKGKEIAAFLAKDPASVTGYLRGGQDLRESEDKLEFFLKSGKKNLNI